MRSFLTVTTILALAACASEPPSPPLTTASAADPNAPVCHREVPTGSNVWRTVCVTPHAADAENQRAVAEVQDKVQHSPAIKAGAVLANQ